MFIVYHYHKVYVSRGTAWINVKLQKFQALAIATSLFLNKEVLNFPQPTLFTRVGMRIIKIQEATLPSR